MAANIDNIEWNVCNHDEKKEDESNSNTPPSIYLPPDIQHSISNPSTPSQGQCACSHPPTRCPHCDGLITPNRWAAVNRYHPFATTQRNIPHVNSNSIPNHNHRSYSIPYGATTAHRERYQPQLQIHPQSNYNRVNHHIPTTNPFSSPRINNTHYNGNTNNGNGYFNTNANNVNTNVRSHPPVVANQPPPTYSNQQYQGSNYNQYGIEPSGDETRSVISHNSTATLPSPIYHPSNIHQQPNHPQFTINNNHHNGNNNQFNTNNINPYHGNLNNNNIPITRNQFNRPEIMHNEQISVIPQPSIATLPYFNDMDRNISMPPISAFDLEEDDLFADMNMHHDYSQNFNVL